MKNENEVDPRREIWISDIDDSLAFNSVEEAVGVGCRGTMTRYVREDIKCRSCLDIGYWIEEDAEDVEIPCRACQPKP